MNEWKITQVEAQKSNAKAVMPTSPHARLIWPNESMKEMPSQLYLHGFTLRVDIHLITDIISKVMKYNRNLIKVISKKVLLAAVYKTS